MTDPDRRIWAGMLAHLRQHQLALCRQWFEELEPLGVVNGALHLRAQSEVHRDYLQRVCAGPFNDAAQAVTGRLIPVRFLGPAQAAPAPARTARGADAGVGSGAGASGRATFEVGRAVAVEAARVEERDELGAARAGEAARSVSGSVATGVGAGGAGAGTLSAPGVTATARVGGNGVSGAASNGMGGHGPGGHSAGGHGTGMSGAGGLGARRAPVSLRQDDSLVVNPDCSFENFVQGPENRLAHAAALSVAASPGRSYNPLFIHGGVGLGKTHVLQAICLRILDQTPGAQIYYLSCESFVSQFFDAVREGEMTQFRHRFRDVDVLVIDDIHFLTRREQTQEEFFHTFNALYQASKQIVLSSDASPAEIPHLEQRLVSRFCWGLVAKIDPPGYETRVEILKTKARLRGLDLPNDVACYVAAKFDANIRELEGALTTLQHVASTEQRPMSVELARGAFGDSTPTVASEPSIQQIIEVVTEHYKTRLTDLQSKRRQRSVALPRQICMFFARRHTRHSLEEIGGYFGGRDHTTVMHAIDVIEERARGDTTFADVLKFLESKIRGARVGV